MLMLLSGPVLAEIVVNNTRLEAAATWCFWSAAQTTFPLLWDYVVGPYMLRLPFTTTYEEKVKAKQYGSEQLELAHRNGPEEAPVIAETDYMKTSLLDQKKK